MQKLEGFFLNRVRVLIFVEEDMRLHARDGVVCASVLEKCQEIVLHIVKIHPVRRAFGGLIAGAKIPRESRRLREDEAFRLEFRGERLLIGNRDLVDRLLIALRLSVRIFASSLSFTGFAR